MSLAGFLSKEEGHTFKFMAIRVAEFSSGGLQNWKYFCLKINIPKGNYWILRIGLMGEVSEIGHHFSKQSDLKIDVIKKCQ